MQNIIFKIKEGKLTVKVGDEDHEMPSKVYSQINSLAAKNGRLIEEERVENERLRSIIAEHKDTEKTLMWAKTKLRMISAVIDDL